MPYSDYYIVLSKWVANLSRGMYQNNLGFLQHPVETCMQQIANELKTFM